MHFTGFQGVLGFEGIVTEDTPMGDADWDVIVNEQEERVDDLSMETSTT